MNPKIKLWVCIFILLISAILLYSPYLWKYNLAANADILYQDIPLRALAAKFWRQGQIPLWNPYNFTGQPLAGLLHAGIFYPPNILYCFLHPILAHKLLIILSLWWLGIGFLLWALQRSFSPFVAFSLALMTIYQPIHLYELIPIRDTLIWLPWMLWAADKLIINNEKYLKIIILNSLIWSLSFLAGFTQFWVYLMITLVCYIIFQKGWKKEWLYVIIITLLFIMPQILLTMPYYLDSPRNTTNFCKANLFLPPFKQIFNTFLCFTIPFNSTLSDYKIFYFSPLIFSACLSILFLRSSSLKFYKLFFLIILLISFLFAFTMLPCYIPYINSFRLHQRFIQSILPYIILIAAAVFFDYWLKNKKGFKIFLISTLSSISLSLIISLWLHKINEVLLRLSSSLDYFLIIIIFLFAFIKINNRFFINIAVISLIILIFVQYKIAYNKWLSDPPFHHFASNSWDENLNYYKKIKSIININKVYTIFPPLPDAKSGLEPLLNTVNDKVQINFISDVFMPAIKRNLRNLFSFYPKIWSLFGVNNYIEPSFFMKFYENYKLKLLNKLTGFRLDNAKIREYVIKQGCLNKNSEGWLLLQNRNNMKIYYISKIIGNSIQYSKLIFENDKISLVCPTDLYKYPYYIIHKKEWILQDMNNKKLFRIPSFIPANKRIQAILLNSKNIIISTINENLQALFLIISISENKIIKKYNQGDNLIELMPFIIYQSKKLEPSFWFYNLKGEAWISAAPNFSFERKIDWEVNLMTKDRRAFSLLTIHKFLQNDEDWQIIKTLSDPNIVIYEYKSEVFPDAWLIDKTLFVNEERNFLNLLVKKPIRYWRTYGIVNDNRKVYSFKEDKKAKVFIEKWEAHNILIRVDTSHYQILVVRLYPYACWGAKVDNKKEELFPINFVMQGIVVPPGNHSIQLACNFLNIFTSIAAKIKG